MFSSGLVVFTVAFIASLAATFLVRKYSPRIGLVDIPSGRKDHERIMPLGGGQAMYAAFTLTVVAGCVVIVTPTRRIESGIASPARIARVELADSVTRATDNTGVAGGNTAVGERIAELIGRAGCRSG